MCAMGKTDLISCQMSLYPLCVEDCITPIKDVVKLIDDNRHISSKVNDMSTVIKGERKAVMQLIEDIQRRMEQNGVQYTMVLTLSNICGCEARD